VRLQNGKLREIDFIGRKKESRITIRVFLRLSFEIQIERTN
jgi:hypothetical protein